MNRSVQSFTKESNISGTNFKGISTTTKYRITIIVSVGSTKGAYSSKPEMKRMISMRTHVKYGNPIT